jgi:hypothetical protein
MGANLNGFAYAYELVAHGTLLETIPSLTKAGVRVEFFLNKTLCYMCKMCMQRPYINFTFSPAKEGAQTQIKRDVLL